MFRIQGYTLPEKKSIRIGLTMIYGIGLKKSKTLLEAAGIPYQKKVSELTEEDQKKISDEVKNHLVENDLRREVQGAIKRIREIKAYRGMRHALGLPVRGQSTRKNARTAKKLMGRSKVRPVLKK